ncbi:P60-like protein [Cristinia sonorae]|uniref:Ribosome biogenesis protein NOP53 n=1 Tax=Cristinia sonorae TaxID=1940300 RepID=A0A8K0USM1_9AGAR|nr:P60-like protein [Cristinia sonorae]
MSSKASTSSKSIKSSIGAPSQRTQPSRKGKRAWRKNVDLDQVEESLEQMRTEERVIGTVLHKTTNDELFQVDVKGDDQVRKRLPKFSTSNLTATKILQQRSAVPAVFSRPQSSTSSLKRKKITHEEKDRLLRIGKKMRKGPFNSVVDPTEFGAGSALLEVSEAAKTSGSYDVWAAPKVEAVEEVVGNAPGKTLEVKAPNTPHPRTSIALSAVPAPHEGTSYNPPAESHESLLRQAYEKEAQRIKEAEQQKELKEKIIEARRLANEDDGQLGAPGMKVDLPTGDAVPEESDEGEERLAKKLPERKTKKERLKAAKRRAEKRALAEKLAQKRLLTSVTSAKSLRKSLIRTTAQRERELLERRRKAEEEKIKNGLAGQKLGRHVVPEGNIDVQLGEDLSESFRGLKPEGNLFRDRFLNMQQRALIEPRVPVIPKKGKAKIKEYEKHPYKKFDREQQ